MNSVFTTYRVVDVTALELLCRLIHSIKKGQGPAAFEAELVTYEPSTTPPHRERFEVRMKNLDTDQLPFVANVTDQHGRLIQLVLHEDTAIEFEVKVGT